MDTKDLKDLKDSKDTTESHSEGYHTSIDLNADTIIRMYDQEKAERSSLESQWQTLATYTLPRKDDIMYKRTPEQKLDIEEVYDDTAIQANITLSNGLQTNLTPPNVKWFSLRARNEELNNLESVKEYFNLVSNQVFRTLTTSNFSEQMHEVYQDLGCFGTSCIFVDEDEKDDARFYALSIPHGIVIFEDNKRRVNKIIRSVEFTTMQALQEFGDEAGETVNNAFKEKQYEKKHTFLHCVGERYVREIGKRDSKNKPYYSHWVSKADRKIVKEGGYDEKPFFVTRFYKNDNSKYGYSPNMVCLPTIKSANRTMALLLQSSDKSVRPPLDVPYKGYMGTINLNPGKINYRRQGVSDGDRLKPIETVGNFMLSIEALQSLQESIKRAYFVNMFLALEDRVNMTATEVAERINEKMAQLGPTLKRLENEMLQGIVHRVFMILIRTEKIPKPPPELMEKADYDVIYTSRLELAQKMSEIQSVDGFMERIRVIASVFPEVLDNIDSDEVLKYYENAYSVPPLLTRRPEMVFEMRQEKQRLQQEQMMLNAGSIGAEAGQKMANAEMNRAKAQSMQNMAGQA